MGVHPSPPSPLYLLRFNQHAEDIKINLEWSNICEVAITQNSATSAHVFLIVIKFQ